MMLSRRSHTQKKTHCMILYKVQKPIKHSAVVEVDKQFSLERREATVIKATVTLGAGNVLFAALGT